MEQQNKRKSGNTFYIVLSLCLIAVGVAAWSAVSAFTDYTKEPELTPEVKEEPQIVTPEVDSPVTNELPKVEYEIKEEKEEPKKEEEEEPKETVPAAEYFLMPIEGNIIKNFDSEALQYSNTFNDMRMHLGIDIAAEKGKAVKSVGKGTVTEIYEDVTFGNTIVIDHGNGIVAKYCGLSPEIAVKTGKVVDAGTELGTLDTVICESADESHLHFEMFKDGAPASPLKIMGME